MVDLGYADAKRRGRQKAVGFASRLSVITLLRRLFNDLSDPSFFSRSKSTSRQCNSSSYRRKNGWKVSAMMKWKIKGRIMR